MKRLFLSLLMFCCACAGARPESSERAPASISGSARWYAQARAAHALADRAHDPAAKSGAMERLAEAAGSNPPAEFAAADAIELRQDLYGRAVQLALDLQQLERASELLAQAAKLPLQPGPLHRQLTILAGRTQAAAGDQPAAELRYREAASE